jgi:hypothetical protein
MLRDAQEQVVGSLTHIVENGDTAYRIKGKHESMRDEGDAVFSEGGE